MGMTVEAFTQAIQFGEQAAKIPGITRLDEPKDTPGLGM